MSKRPRKEKSDTESKARPTRPAQPSSATAPQAQSDASLQKVLHELEVHQIELEMQNAELQVARNDAEAAREKYADLYDFAPVGYFALDTAGTIQMVNLTGASLAGIERSLLVGRRFDRLISSRLRSDFATFLARVFAAPGKQSIETEIAVTGMSPKFVNVEAQSGPEAQQCRVVAVDITERKRAEERLIQNEALVSSLIEQAPVGVYVVDSELRLHQVNKVAKPLLGDTSPDDCRDLQEVLSGIWPKRVVTQVVARFRHTLATGEPYQSTAFRERRRDTGATEDYEWQIQRLALGAGEYGVVAFFNNITSRKKTESAQRRLAVLTATNLVFKEEIEQRKAIERSLRSAKKKQASLLRQSASQQAQLRDLSHSLIHAQEQERQRISRELHDVVVQSLVGISFQLAAIGHDTAEDATKLKQKIKRAQELVANSTEVVHSFARELRPTLLDDLGLVPALQTYLQRFMEDTGVRASLHVSKAAPVIDGEARTTIYRVTQEALANIARHAHADQAKVSIQGQNGSIRLEVTDNGQGFEVGAESHAKARGRLGLLGMRERVEMIGGTFSIHSEPGSGTTVTVALKASKRTPNGAGAFLPPKQKNGDYPAQRDPLR